MPIAPYLTPELNGGVKRSKIAVMKRSTAYLFASIHGLKRMALAAPKVKGIYTQHANL